MFPESRPTLPGYEKLQAGEIAGAAVGRSGIQAQVQEWSLDFGVVRRTDGP
jgi:hypothetical protein